MIKTRLIQLLSHAGKYIVYNVLWQWFALLCQIAVVFSITALLEGAVTGNLQTQDMVRTAAVFAAAALIRFGCDRGAAHASFAASVDVKRILREKIYDKLLRLGASYREQTATSEVVQMAAEGVEQLETYFGRYLPQLFYSLLAPVTLFAVLSFVSLKASVVLLICVPLIPISIVAVQKFAKRLLSRYWGVYTGLGDSFLENLQGLTTLKIYQADGQKAEEMDQEAERFRNITMKVLTMQLNSTSVMDIVAYGGAAVGMIVAVSEYLSGTLSFAGALTIILLASEFFIPLRLLGSFFHIAMNGMAASDKIFCLLDLPEPEKGTKELGGSSLDVDFENVSFSYEEDRQILKEISFRIPAGSMVSLVGESGCGKSTAAAVLMGRNRGYQGSVRLGGVELSEVSEESLMKSVTRVAHNSYLFKGTVEENLRMGKPDANRQEMIAVLRKVNLWGFLEAQEGLDTKIQEKGSNFSGGQCQRLALARALLHDTPVYIFDEATSNIDVESEEMIMEVIRELAKTRTVLLISHRLANVVTSDCIYMMVQGEIREAGTHQELMQKDGSYQKLFESQQKLENYRRRASR
ncbi:MAG: ABC transporter ATP-binding protein/permease [Lachnospiraceae bacterium]|nr:ABC transporter ATP-binding protein/permease [Lachnospiraceae bacterium]